MAFDRRLSFGFTAFALIVGSSGVALAQGSRGNVGDNKINRCSIYGSDFVEIEGTDGCARVGGHIRVEVRNGNSLRGGFNTSNSDGTRPAVLNSSQHAVQPSYELQGDTRSHLRVRELPGSRDLFAR